jgi:deazaflavin-dependent oxidoreductase (nitroreductase family)
MSLIPKLWDLTGGAVLMRSGRAGSLTTVGRFSGRPRTIQCGYMQRPTGTVLVGAATGRQWPRNLEAAGWCFFSARDMPDGRYDARVLEGEERAAAIDEFRTARGERAAAILSGLVFELHRMPQTVSPQAMPQPSDSGDGGPSHVQDGGPAREAGPAEQDPAQGHPGRSIARPGGRGSARTSRSRRRARP